MASQMSAQDLGLKTNKASAADTIAQFNTQQRAATGAANQGYRIDRATQLANLRNQEEVANKGLIQQNFQNQIQKAGGVAQAQSAQAGNLQQQAAGAQQAQQAQTGAILNLAGTLGAAGIKSKSGKA